MATTRPRPSSILLQTYSPLSLTSSTSSISSQSSHKKDLLVVTAKHIRFAPLPEPDRDNPHNTTQISNPSAEDCDPDPPRLIEHILTSSNSSSSSSQLSSPTTFTSQCELSPNSSVGSSPIIQPSNLPSKYPPTPISPNPNSPTCHTTTINPDSSSSSQPPPHWGKKPHIFLRPFIRSSASSSASSSHTLTPTPSIENRKKRVISTEEILTLGAVNLFRPPSRESTRSHRSTRSVRDNHSSTWGLDLSRWPSLGGSNSNIPTGFPLTRTQSTQSHKSKSSSLFPTFPSSSSSSLSSDSKMKAKVNPNPLVQQSLAANRRKGTRMLNGRVYGGPKKNVNANPFANARDEETEFVEWGYGGMGSVKGARSAGVSSNWERLHGGSAMGGGDKTRRDVGVGASIGAGDADLDDGSGTAWVKRRKEERERKAREQKEKEAEEAEKENSESQMNTPVPTRSSTLESITTISSPSDIEPATHIPPPIDVSPLTVVLEEDGETATKPGFPASIPSRYTSEPGVYSSSQLQNPLTKDSTNADQGKPEEGPLPNNAATHENERVLQAITVPVRSPRHHHHRQPSKVGSRELLSSPLPEGSAALQVVTSPIPVSPGPNVGGGGDTMAASTGLLHTSTITSTEMDNAPSPSSFSSSFEESGSESEGDDGDDEDEDEDEEESQKQNERMKTTLGTAAGVEKISRHKE